MLHSYNFVNKLCISYLQQPELSLVGQLECQSTLIDHLCQTFSYETSWDQDLHKNAHDVFINTIATISSLVVVQIQDKCYARECSLQ